MLAVGQHAALELWALKRDKICRESYQRIWPLLKEVSDEAKPNNKAIEIRH